MLTGKRVSGFTLLEMAVVLMIIGLLLGGLLPIISTQRDVQRSNETQKQLNEIKDALIGFALINDRLPCPASSSSNGQESFCTNASGSCGASLFVYPNHGRCSASTPYDGFLPAAALGISPTDTEGFAIDAWGNRIRYAVTSWNKTSAPAQDNVYTTRNGMSTIGISNLNPGSFSYLLVCTTATGVNPATPSCASSSESLTSSPGVPVVIYSTGAKAGTGTDETENSDGDRIFVSHTPTPSTATNGEFDDIVTWISPNTLINRMVAAGKLP